MVEFHTNIWDLIAYRVAKRIAGKRPLTIELVREISDELRIINETLIVQIYFRLPDAKEMLEIENEMTELAKK